MKSKIQLLLVAIFIVPIVAFSQQNIDILILNKSYDKAFAEIEKQINKAPKAGLYLKKGMIYESLQDYQNALEAFTTGLQMQPQNIDLLSQSAGCFALLGNNPDAVNFYKEASNLAPQNLALVAKLGRVYINLKKYHEAYDVFSGIYMQDSSKVYWNKQLAYCAFRIFNREQASALYEKVLEANPRDYGSYSNLIHTYNWKKEGGKVMSTIERGLVQFPNDASLLLERAMYLYKTKQYNEAMINFEKYVAAEKEPPYDILMNVGISTYFAGYEEKALDKFKALLLLNPNDPLVLYYQSLCHKKMKNFEKSQELMEWAIDASIPNYVAEMYHHLGQIYGQQRKFKESLVALEKSYELNVAKSEVLFEIATTYEEYNSNKTLALNYYRIYLKEAGGKAKNTNYALDRITKLKEDLFFDE